MRIAGDNTDEIQEICREFLVGVQREWEEKAAVYQKIKEKEKKEELKKHPNYKEIPDFIQSSFQKLGIAVFVNSTKIVIPPFKRGMKSIHIEPFGAWFFKDSNGKNGRLYQVKEILKNKYRASFCSVSGSEIPENSWYISSGYTLEEIYKIIA